MRGINKVFDVKRIQAPQNKHHDDKKNKDALVKHIA